MNKHFFSCGIYVCIHSWFFTRIYKKLFHTVKPCTVYTVCNTVCFLQCILLDIYKHCSTYSVTRFFLHTVQTVQKITVFTYKDLHTVQQALWPCVVFHKDSATQFTSLVLHCSYLSILLQSVTHKKCSFCFSVCCCVLVVSLCIYFINCFLLNHHTKYFIMYDFRDPIQIISYDASYNAIFR